MNLTNAVLAASVFAALAAACNTQHNIGTTAPAADGDAAAPGPQSPTPPAGDGAVPRPPATTPADGPARTSDAPDGGALPPPDGAAALPGCPPGQATPEEIAATPRADMNLEMLALWISKKLVAPQSIYDRIVRDVPAIRKKAPQFARWRFMEPFVGKSLLVKVTSETLQAMRNGTYQPWVCPNKLYGALEEKFNLSGFADLISLEFKGTYNEDLLAEEYGRMPGVRSAQRNGLGGLGGEWQTICATPEGDTWHYVFATYFGMDGVNGSYTHFAVGADGVVNDLGSYQGPMPFTPNPAPLPDWVVKYVNKNACVLP